MKGQLCFLDMEIVDLGLEETSEFIQFSCFTDEEKEIQRGEI